MQRVNQGSLGGNSQMVSNDGLSMMELPAPNSKRHPAKSGGHQQPKKVIPPLQYIVFDNPQGSYDFLFKKGYNVDNKVESVYHFAKIFLKDKGEAGLLELVREAHPDRDIILKATGHNTESNFCCGFDGKPETTIPNKQVSVNEPAPQTKEAISNPVTTATSDEKQIKIGTTTLIIILLIVLVFVVLMKNTSKS